MSDPAAPPDWFLDAFRAALPRCDLTLVELESWNAHVEHPARGKSRLGLDSVYRRTLLKPRAEAGAVILEHLRRMESVRPVATLAAGRERVYPRIRVAVDDPSLKDAIWQKPIDGTNLVVVLVIDYPEAMTYVTADMIDESGRPGDEWLAVATENLAVNTDPGMVISLDDGLFGVGTADAYDAARPLVMERLVGEPDPLGYVVGLPNRDRFFFYPVGDDPHDGRIVSLLKLTLAEYRRGTYPITPALYWLYEGELHHVAIDVKEGSITTTLPDKLYDLLPDVDEDEGDES